VVIDTNVLVRNFKSRAQASPNRQVFRLWLVEKRLHLVVSQELLEEYLEIFEAILGLDRATIAAWQARFVDRRRSSLVNLGRRYTASRDPDDNLLLATAFAGKADYLITNDWDLLELPADFRRALPFIILSPKAFLMQWTKR
jgi:putative PIN family toxin of toxin-antitoxin system